MEGYLPIHIANIIGTLVLVIVLFSNIWRVNDRRDTRKLLVMIGIVALSCGMDSLAYIVDGLDGVFFFVVNFLSNSWLYFANVLACVVWVKFVAQHLNVTLAKWHQYGQYAFLAVAAIFLIINIFYPLVFSIDENNCYDRGPLYWLYFAIAFAFMADSLVIYYVARYTSGFLKLFPIWIFLCPVVAAAIVQTVVYGVTVIWAGVAIGIVGVTSSLKNEIILRDRLTGLYNRSYLDYLKKAIDKKSKGQLTGIMLDLNQFKSINDRFGHAVGDEALRLAASIMRKTVGKYGIVIRYAGDEFIVLLNSNDEEMVKATIQKIKDAFDKFNADSGEPYQLSAAFGSATFDLKTQTMNDFMNAIDVRMYENKRQCKKDHYHTIECGEQE